MIFLLFISLSLYSNQAPSNVPTITLQESSSTDSDVSIMIQPTLLECTTQLDPDKITEVILQYYFKKKESPSRTLQLSLQKQVASLTNSDSPSKQIDLLEGILKHNLNHKHKKFISKLVVSALSEALQQTELRVDRRWTKKQSAYLAAGTALVTTIITSVVVVLIEVLAA